MILHWALEEPTFCLFAESKKVQQVLSCQLEANISAQKGQNCKQGVANFFDNLSFWRKMIDMYAWILSWLQIGPISRVVEISDFQLWLFRAVLKKRSFFTGLLLCCREAVSEPELRRSAGDAALPRPLRLPRHALLAPHQRLHLLPGEGQPRPPAPRDQGVGRGAAPHLHDPRRPLLLSCGESHLWWSKLIKSSFGFRIVFRVLVAVNSPIHACCVLNPALYFISWVYPPQSHCNIKQCNRLKVAFSQEESGVATFFPRPGGNKNNSPLLAFPVELEESLHKSIFSISPCTSDHTCFHWNLALKLRLTLKLSLTFCVIQMGERTRTPRKRIFMEQLSGLGGKLSRLHEDSLMPPQPKDLVCSCPPFECLCRPVPPPHHSHAHMPSTDTFQQDHVLPAFVPQPGLLSPTALSFPGHASANPFEALDHVGYQQQPITREAYSEYFDLSNMERYNAQGFGSHCGDSLSGPVKSEPMQTQTDLFNAANRSKSNVSIPDCMYGSSNMSPVQERELVLPSYPQSQMTKSEPSSSPLSNPGLGGATSGSPFRNQANPYNSPPPQYHFTPVSASDQNFGGVTATAGVQNPHCSSTLSPTTLDEFEFNDAADFLSLDQPINKDLPAPACAVSANRKQPTITSSDVTKGATSDLSSLLGLPSISSFLDEGEGENPANEHIDKILGLSLNYSVNSPRSNKSTGTDSLSPASSGDQKVPSDGSPLSPCRGTTPPSLIELQPLKANNNNNTIQHNNNNNITTTSPKKFTDIFQTANSQGNLHPRNQSHFGNRNLMQPSYPETPLGRNSNPVYFSPKMAAAEDPGLSWYGFPSAQSGPVDPHQQNHCFSRNHSISIPMTYNWTGPTADREGFSSPNSFCNSWDSQGKTSRHSGLPQWPKSWMRPEFESQGIKHTFCFPISFKISSWIKHFFCKEHFFRTFLSWACVFAECCGQKGKLGKG